MVDRIIESFAEEDTFKLGVELGQNAIPGDVITLIGDLGVGKTILAKGMAKGLGIEEDVSSPTFTIVQEYHEGRIPLYHFDVYRIEEPEEMEAIGYEEYFFGDGVCLVEWADLISEIIPSGHTRVTVEKDLEKGFDYRKITIEKR